MTNHLAVRSRSQQILFTQELKGQISDGMWENARPYDHWQAWCRAEVVIDPENVGRDFYVDKDNYNFNSSFLVECVGDRMLASVQAELPSYTMKDLRADLKDLKVIARTRRRG